MTGLSLYDRTEEETMTSGSLFDKQEQETMTSKSLANMREEQTMTSMSLGTEQVWHPSWAFRYNASFDLVSRLSHDIFVRSPPKFASTHVYTWSEKHRESN